MIQLQVKYFMKIRQELDIDDPKIKVGYYDLSCMHKESNRIKRRKTTKKKKEEKIHFYEHSFHTSSVDTYDWNSNLC